MYVKKVWLGLALGFVGASAAQAEIYKVSLTRKDTNFYQIDNGKLYLRTKYCFEFAMGQDAIIDTDKQEVVFLGYSPSKCDVDMILSQVG